MHTFIKVSRYALLIFILPLFALSNGDDPTHAHEDSDTAPGAHIHKVGTVVEGTAVNLNATPVPFETGVPIQLDFFVVEKPGDTPVAFADLEIDHGSLLRAFGVREDLNEFFSLEPSPISSENVFSKNFVFRRPGSYRVWSEITENGEQHFYEHPEMSVRGNGDTVVKEINFGKNVIVGNNTVGNYQVEIVAGESVAKGRAADISFAVRTATGDGVVLETYRGEVMHLFIVSEDFDYVDHAYPELDHTHEATGIIPIVYAHGGLDDGHELEAEVVNFHVTFPQGGIYRLFAEFRPEDSGLPVGAALTAGFWLNVSERAASTSAQWWGLFIVSLILITILSFAVYTFIYVKE